MTPTRHQTVFRPVTSYMPAPSGLLQRQCACGTHTAGSGECAECSKKKFGLQRKLMIGASNDALELEADRVADQVMATSAHSAVSGAPPRIQRFAGQPIGETATAPASVDRVPTDSGRPLEPTLRKDMEQRFGQDFNRDRSETDPEAKESAQAATALTCLLLIQELAGTPRLDKKTGG